MLTKTQKIIILAVSFIVIAGLIVWLVFGLLGNKNVETIHELSPSSETTKVDTGKKLAELMPEISEEEKKEFSAQVLARVFAEKFGTYSNHQSYQSILDSQQMMTSSMKSWSSSFVVKLKKTKGDQFDDYYGISTSALKVEVVELDEDSAEFLVKCQRTEYPEAGQPVVYNQNLKLNLIKIDNDWKVSAAYWQDKEA